MSPTLRLHDELIVDSFAGGGGASLGIEWALGRSPDIAVNHDANAIAMHAANHPTTRHLCGDVWDVDPNAVCDGRRVALAWFSPDCFPAGSMILTLDGYRPIEEIEIGEYVLTHEGRWRAVTATMRSRKPLLRVKGRGHPGLLVSPEHPFLARRREDVWNTGTDGRPRGYRRHLEPSAWIKAGELGAGWYWASPTEFPSLPVPSIPEYRGRRTTITPELMWLVGRYVADGWTRLTDTRAELVITCGRHEALELREQLSVWPRNGMRAASDEMAWHERETATAYQFTVNHRGLVEWLREHFGHGASEKRIPGWALGMDRGLREALLGGYASGDGHVRRDAGNSLFMCSTVSKSLAFGMKALACSLGFSPAVYFNPTPNSMIDGRRVNARPIWSVRWRLAIDASHIQTFRDGHHEWASVDSVEEIASDAEVFNLSVDEDESYVVEGIVVHNCKHFSKAKGGKPCKARVRSLAWVVVRWAKTVRPRVIILENVEEFADWGPLLNDGRPDPARRGLTFRRWLAQLTNAGYCAEVRELRASDFGAPTSRKRLFIIARSDGLPIVWPSPTHGAGAAQPHRTAAECITWELGCPSIFGRAKPLAENTLRRIGRGVWRYVIGAAQPFVVPVTHAGDQRAHSLGEPLRTVTGAHRGEMALVSPTLIQRGWGERPGQAPRVPGIDKPLGTICAQGEKHALVTAFLAKHFGGHEGPGATLALPMSTVTAQDHHALVAAHMIRAKATHRAEVRAFLVKYYGTGSGNALQLPLDTVTTHDRFGLVRVAGSDFAIADIGMRMLAPRELFRAQGFPDSYVIDPLVGGAPLSKTAQIRACGNSVCPPIAAAIVRAQFAAEATEAA